MASLVEKVTRAALGLVAAQSPDRAGEMAFWLFTRTRSTKPQSDKERKALELAKARMDESETVRLSFPAVSLPPMYSGRVLTAPEDSGCFWCMVTDPAAIT
jgi:hypothetical protein